MLKVIYSKTKRLKCQLYKEKISQDEFLKDEILLGKKKNKLWIHRNILLNYHLKLCGTKKKKRSRSFDIMSDVVVKFYLVVPNSKSLSINLGILKI